MSKSDCNTSLLMPLKYFNCVSDAEPCEEERLLYSDVAEVLRGSHQVIHDLQQYKGAAKEIKEVSNELYRTTIWHNKY